MARRGGSTRRRRRGGSCGGTGQPCQRGGLGCTQSGGGRTRRRRGGTAGVVANAAVPVVLIALNEYFKNTKRGQSILDKLRKDAKGVI